MSSHFYPFQKVIQLYNPDNPGGGDMKEKILLSDSVKLILGRYINPYRKIYEFQDALDIVAELIKLLEKYGDCPSVVATGSGPEADTSPAVKDRFASVTLREHTYGVTLNMVKALKKSITDYDMHMPKAVITGLAHDIGKIPRLTPDPAGEAHEHQIISARWLEKMFYGKNQTLARQVINAVENHHTCLRDDFACMLKKADQEARQSEFVRFSQKPRIASLDTWFSIEDFYWRISPYINFPKSDWQAFTFRDLVYCKPQLIYETAKALCEEAKIIDPLFRNMLSHDKALHKIISLLRDYDFIPDLFKEGKARRLYAIKTETGTHKTYLIPLKPAGFYRWNEIERKKTEFFFRDVKSVYPTGKGD
jgi:hypothetical protein